MRHLISIVSLLAMGPDTVPNSDSRDCIREPRCPGPICHAATVTGQARAAETGPISLTTGTVAVDVANLAAATTAEETVTFPGALVNNIVTANPRTTITTGLVITNWFVKAANVLAYTVANVTTASVNGTAVTFDIALRAL